MGLPDGSLGDSWKIKGDMEVCDMNHTVFMIKQKKAKMGNCFGSKPVIYADEHNITKDQFMVLKKTNESAYSVKRFTAGESRTNLTVIVSGNGENREKESQKTKARGNDEVAKSFLTPWQAMDFHDEEELKTLNGSQSCSTMSSADINDLAVW